MTKEMPRKDIREFKRDFENDGAFQGFLCNKCE